MKRFIALVLSLIMALSLCAPAWGAGESAIEVDTAAELIAAVEDIADGGTITLAADLTFNESARTNSGGDWYEGLYYIGDKSFTIDLNKNTITNDEAVNDYLMLFKNDGAKANTITFTNGTIEAASSAYCAICTSTGSTRQITINLENVNLTGNNSNGSVAKIRGGAVLNVKAGTVITGKDSYLGIENANATVNIYDGAEIYQNGTTSYNGCLVGAGSNGTVNVYGGYGKGVAGGFIAMTSGGTINVYGGEWIADTDGTFSGNDYVLIAQSDKKTYEGAGNSVVNVYDGTFNGTYNCYGNAVGDAQINISAGTFNANPSTYVDTDVSTITESNGTYTVTERPNVATADGVPYKSLQAAVNAGGKVVLLDNITLAEGVTVPAGKTVELDLAGKTITCEGEAYIYIDSHGPEEVGSLTVKDSVGNGRIVGVVAMSGNLNLESGTITSAGYMVSGIPATIVITPDSWAHYPVLNVTGGTIEFTGKPADFGEAWLVATAIAGATTNGRGPTLKFSDAATVKSTAACVFMGTGIYDHGDITVDGGYFTAEEGFNTPTESGIGAYDKVSVSGGYFTFDPSAYCIEDMTGVTSDKAGYLYMVGEKNTEIETPADVVVATPAPEVNVTTTNATEKAVVDELKKAEAVEISTDALTAQAKDVANNTSAEATDDHVKALDEAIATNNTPITKDDVTIVVQPFFDVAVKDVAVETEGTGAGTTVTSASITVNITPMYQTVATTADLDNGDEIVTDKDDDDHNAVVIDKGELTITEPVEIKIAIPAALAIDDGEGGYKSLYVTHVKDNGTKYVYEAKVEKNGNDYTATFTNPNGFSLFTLSVENTTAAKVGNDSYADLQSAIDNAGKDATITVVKSGNHKATVKGATSFKVELENGATVTITAAPGYKVSGPDANGVYTVTKVTSGGYYPYYPPTTTPDSELVKSPDTFDAGVALYVGVSIIGAVGTVALGKKRED